jgi:hypothetical protein
VAFGGSAANPDIGHVKFWSYFNPTPNDKNLEFDVKKNLFNPDEHDYWWPRIP